MEIVEGYMQASRRPPQPQPAARPCSCRLTCRRPPQGERDYLHLKGGTGPAVYPAGFMYIFSALRWVTGGAILPAQVGRLRR